MDAQKKNDMPNNNDHNNGITESNEAFTDDLIPEEILKDIPINERSKFAAIIKHTMFSGILRPRSPLSEKITSEHISEIIKRSDEQDKRDREEREKERKYNLLILIIALVFIGFLIVYLNKNENLLIKIIIGLVSFIGGYGFGKTKQKKE